MLRVGDPAPRLPWLEAAGGRSRVLVFVRHFG